MRRPFTDGPDDAPIDDDRTLEERLEDLRERREERREEREERREIWEALREIDGDPDDRVAPEDLNASEDFTLTEDEETGNAVINTPFRTQLTNILFEDVGGDFVELAAMADSILMATRALNDPDALEPEDLDAATDFFVTESEDGDAVINGPLGAREIRIDYIAGETDSFTGLAEAREAARPEGRAEARPEGRPEGNEEEMGGEALALLFGGFHFLF